MPERRFRHSTTGAVKPSTLQISLSTKSTPIFIKNHTKLRKVNKKTNLLSIFDMLMTISQFQNGKCSVSTINTDKGKMTTKLTTKRTFACMQSKKIIILLSLVFFGTTLFAQKIRLKNQKVLIDGTEVFKYESGKSGRCETVSLYNIISNEEVIFLKSDDGGTITGENAAKDDFITYNFLKIKTKAEIRRLFILRNEIYFLYSKGVFDLSGNLNTDKIALFKEKYDEDITSKIVISR